MRSKLRRFRVEIGGKVYEVKVEEIEETGQRQIREISPREGVPADPTPKPKATPEVGERAPAREATVAPKAGEGAMAEGAVLAPMPGLILRLNFEVGDTVKAGDVIAVLEAMKMENEIVSHKSGIIKEIRVSEGKPVDSNEVIAIIE